MTMQHDDIRQWERANFYEEADEDDRLAADPDPDRHDEGLGEHYLALQRRRRNESGQDYFQRRDRRLDERDAVTKGHPHTPLNMDCYKCEISTYTPSRFDKYRQDGYDPS